MFLKHIFQRNKAFLGKIIQNRFNLLFPVVDKARRNGKLRFQPPNCYNLGGGGELLGLKFLFLILNKSFFQNLGKELKVDVFSCVEVQLDKIWLIQKQFFSRKKKFFQKIWFFFFGPNMIKIKIELKKRVFIRFCWLHPQNFRNLFYCSKNL